MDSQVFGDQSVASSSEIKSGASVRGKIEKIIFTVVFAVGVLGIIGWLTWFAFSVASLKKDDGAGERGRTEYGLLQMQNEASRSMEDFWAKMFVQDGSTDSAIESMFDAKVVQNMAAYGDSLCGKAGGLCGFPRVTHDLVAAINESLDGADDVGCDMKSNRLKFKFICRYTGEPMYDVYPYINPHKMTGVCDFDTKDTFKKKYTPVKTNVTMTWNIPERRWKVTDIQMMLQEGIVTIDQKSVRSELIFRGN